MKRLLFSCHAWSATQRGFSLAELSVVLGLLAIGTSWAMPSLSSWLWRLRVESVVQAWRGDLQTAQLQALRRGENLELQRLNSCQSTPLADGDWRCGWQLVRPTASATPLITHNLGGELLLQLYPGQNLLPINGQGEAVAGGLRLTVQAKNLKTVVRSICINNTGRLRVVASEVCT
jgi:prepilin-type N-terminal cleavage/methylation domain-containing protein